ncbi:hypothetical protein JW960_06365 [candidate division KSB1 bacterium]|nr:hypothetical protein [candidate division KSB1 bacterium]
MPQLCIINTGDDKRFVKLFATLLEFHYIETQFQDVDTVKNAMDVPQTDSFLILLSQNSLTSINLKNVVEKLETKYPTAQYIIALLDPIHPDEFTFHLRNYHAINFSQDMLKGFTKLMSLFDVTFLPKYDRREKIDRREYSEQRHGDDRRVSNLSQRIRTGFWKSYAMATGAGVYDYLMMEAVQQVLVIEFLKPEAEHYEYLDAQGNVQETSTVLENCCQIVWDRFGKGSFERAIFIIEALADTILDNYSVKMLDRRQEAERRAGDDRRKIKLNYSYTAA